MPQSSRTARKAESKSGRIQGASLYCLGLLVSIAACEALAPSAPLPENAQLMSAPPQFMEWWQKTEECSGLRGDPSQIEWYVVPNVSVFSTGDGEKVGLWTRSSEGTRIILAGNYMQNELVVRHEMLHALLDHEGHPKEYFIERCGLTWDSWHGGN